MKTEPSQVELSYRHNNMGLFSNHYLNNRLRDRAEFKEQDAELAFRNLQRKWNELNPEGLKESQTEDLWIKPVLDQLGHHYAVQVSVDTPRNVREPDYVLARSVERRSVLKGVLTEDDLSDELAVADAKRWDRDLDSKIREGATLSDTPSLQIDFYLRYSGLDWGILTNGRLWRLYHKDTSHKLEVFYQVDLVELLKQDEVEEFKYFYLFFRRPAFEGDPSFLERMLEESKAYEHAVSDNLEEQVYDALAALSQGFLDLESNNLDPDAATLEKIHDNSLIVLYRLLFLLFAESRGLLPLETNRIYRQDYSLEQIKARIADRGAKSLGIADSNKLWNSLKELWRFVDAGQNELDIPAYNGGLFSPNNYPFLERYEVGDRHLARAIDLLARTTDETSGQREFVDYRDLEVRHLGAVYEGLLEYKLRFAEVPLTVGEDGGYTPADSNEDTSVDAGQVYLVTDKGERKATGSYYTPEHIVQYITERTVGPVIEELRNEHTTDEGDLVGRADLVEKVLNINVLDPAMGSGHFLVEVTDFIARFLVEVAPEVDASDAETELGYWRRRVAQACVYGVDLNPLAVELSKLSLWLRTVAKDKPLSFLDHHLRCGNSLVGAQVEDLPLQTEQTRHYREKEQREGTFFDTQTFQEAMSSATDLMQRIEDIAGDKLEQVQEAAELYEKLLEEHTKAPRLVANVVLAQEFGLDIDSDFFEEMLPRLRDGSWESAHQYREVVNQAKDIADDHGFFHWELEFPEVFFGEGGEAFDKAAGFDAVVGNPPYINANELNNTLSEHEKPYWKTKFQSAHGAYDIYVLFLELCLNLTSYERLVGLITPNKYLSAPYALALRQYLADTHELVHLYDVSAASVFPGASVYPVVSIWRKENRGGGAAQYKFNVATWQPQSDAKSKEFDADSLGLLPDKIWGFLLAKGSKLVAQISKRCCELTDLVEVVASSTAAEADEYSEVIFEKGHSSSGDEKPVVNTGTIDPFRSLWGVEELRHQGDSYLRPVLDLGANVVPNRRVNQYKSAKLIFAKVALRVEAVVDLEGDFGSMNTNFAIGSSREVSLLGAICNSRLMTWFYERYFGGLRMSGGYLQFQAPQISVLPIPAEVERFLECEDNSTQKAKESPSEYAEKVMGNGDAVEICEAIGALSSYLVDLWCHKNRLDKANKPFKYLDRGIEVGKFRDLWRDEIKFAEVVTDISRFHHDIDGLRLVNGVNGWELAVLLKKRDPETDWAEWLKDGRNIQRDWVTAYRFPTIDNEKAIYFEKSFSVLGEFEHTGSFPRGKTRSSKKKLDLTEIPKFDESAELEPLAELTDELEVVASQIEVTDEHINQLVYDLYDLTEDEIRLVEESAE